MHLHRFSLKIHKKQLLTDVSVTFNKGINHLLGKNGTGKTCLAKALYGILPYKGTVEHAFPKGKTAIIGSYTALPLDLCVKDILRLALKTGHKEIYTYLYSALELSDIPEHNTVKRLSDGQKQKLKILFFLMPQPHLIILDEFSNALDKTTALQLYRFFNAYALKNDVLVINITHNMSDLEHMGGSCFLLENRTLIAGLSKEAIIDSYIKG